MWEHKRTVLGLCGVMDESLQDFNQRGSLKCCQMGISGEKKQKKKEVNEYRVDDEQEFVCVPIKQLVRRL